MSSDVWNLIGAARSHCSRFDQTRGRTLSQSHRNEGFSGWPNTFCTAALRRDRRPAHLRGQIIDTGTKDCRFTRTAAFHNTATTTAQAPTPQPVFIDPPQSRKTVLRPAAYRPHLVSLVSTITAAIILRASAPAPVGICFSVDPRTTGSDSERKEGLMCGCKHRISEQLSLVGRKSGTEQGRQIRPPIDTEHQVSRSVEKAIPHVCIKE